MVFRASRPTRTSPLPSSTLCGRCPHPPHQSGTLTVPRAEGLLTLSMATTTHTDLTFAPDAGASTHSHLTSGALVKPTPASLRVSTKPAIKADAHSSCRAMTHIDLTLGIEGEVRVGCGRLPPHDRPARTGFSWDPEVRSSWSTGPEGEVCVGGAPNASSRSPEAHNPLTSGPQRPHPRCVIDQLLTHLEPTRTSPPSHR